MKGFISENICDECGFENCLKQMGVKAKSLELLNSIKREVFYQKGETLFKQGTLATHIAFIREGVVKLLVESENRRRFIIRLITPGNYIGFSTFTENFYYPYSVIALKDTQACLIDKNFFKKLIDETPGLSEYVMKWLSNDYHFQHNRFSALGTKQIHGRFAELLLYLTEEDLQKEQIYNHLTRKDLAELAGMSVDSVLKIINELKNDRVMEIKGKDIIIKDLKAIQQLSKFG